MRPKSIINFQGFSANSLNYKELCGRPTRDLQIVILLIQDLIRGRFFVVASYVDLFLSLTLLTESGYRISGSKIINKST